MSAIGRIHSFESFGTLDGPGIRYVVFMQGCPLRCKFCHNPDTWEPSCGKEISVEQILSQITACRNFLRTGGVTLSGGEPLLQRDFCLALLEACKAAGFHTALDTAGSLPLSSSKEVIDSADMLLLDIKSLDNDICTRLTGRDNCNTLATLDYCESSGKRVWIRHVLIPGWTLDDNLLTALAEYLSKYKCIERVELLPYHKMAAEKWQSLNLPDPLDTTPSPDVSAVCNALELFRTHAPELTVF